MDKNKIIEAAAKLIAKGAYDKAIKEYQKILDVDGKDVRVLQKMAELYQRKNDNTQAADYFSKVAESYAADGFFLKAVAQYKQVIKTNPSLTEVNLKLAELHQQLGLMSEAMAYFQVYANALDQQGNTKGSLDVLKKMVDLDPDNVASRIKLAELYAREQMNPQAIGEFKRAADYLNKNNRTDDYLRVAERISALEPDNVQLARELAQSYLQKGDQKRALAKLQVCFKADPRDVDTLNLLAQAFHALGQTSKTVSVYKELAKLSQEKGRAQEANQIWDKIAELDPSDPDLAARRQSSRPAPAPAPAAPARGAAAAPAAPPSAPPAPASGGGAKSPKDQLAKLLTETDVYVKYGLHDKALEHLRRVFAIDPESLEAHEKAYQIYVSAKHVPQAAEQRLNVLRLCTRRSDVQRAQPYLDSLIKESPNHPELPTFLAVLRPGAAAMPVEAEEVVAEEELLVEPVEELVEAEPAGEDFIAAEAEVDESGEDIALAAADHGGDEVVEEIEQVTDPGPGSQVFEDEPLVAMDDEPLGEVDEVVEETALEIETEARTQTATAIEPMEPVEPAPEELAFETAIDDDVVEEEPGLGRAESITEEELAAADSTGSYDFTEQVVTEEPEPASPQTQTEISTRPYADEDPLTGECDEAEFFLEQGELAEAREILETVVIASPGHPRASALLERLDALEASGAQEHEAPPEEEVAPPSVQPMPQGASEGRDAFDLAAELADELGELGGEEPAPAASGGDDYQVSMEEVFSEFKKGVAKVVKPEDVDTHYDLGIAYKEMGLIDDAIGEFTVARQGCLGKKKEIDCISMIGLLQLSKGDAAAAVGAFLEALQSEHAVGDAAKGIGYDLAIAHEQAGSAGKALYRFQQVAKLDAGFRDVSAQIARLSTSAKPEPDDAGGKAGGAKRAEASNGAPPNGKPPAGSNGAPAAARPPTGSNGIPAAKPAAPKASTDAPKPPPGKTRKVGYL